MFKILSKISSSIRERHIPLFLISNPQYRSLILKPTGGDREVGIGFLATPYFNAEDVVKINSFAEDIPENRSRVEENYTIIRNNNSFKTPHRNNLLTHVFYTTDSSETELPLFYQHLIDLNQSWDGKSELEYIKEAADGDQKISSIIASIKILDKDFLPSSDSKFVIKAEYQKGFPEEAAYLEKIVVYNNLESEYQSRTGNFNVYYVQWTDIRNRQHVALLDNLSIYYRKTLETLHYKYTYSLTEEGTYWGIKINYPTNPTKIAVKAAKSARLYGKLPLAKEPSDHWAPLINNGSFKTVVEGTVYDYTIREFSDNQNFYPIYPYKQVNRLPAVPLTKNLLWIPAAPLVYGTSVPIDIIVKNNKKQIKYAYTTDTTKAFYTERTPDNKLLTAKYRYINDTISLSKSGGFIYMGPYTHELDDIVLVSAYYEESSYEIPNVELNPVFQRDQLDKILVAFVIPNVDIGEEALCWFILDKYNLTVDEVSGEMPYVDIKGLVRLDLWLLSNEFDYYKFLYYVTSSYTSHWISNEEITLTDIGDSLFTYSFAYPPAWVEFSNKSVFSTKVEGVPSTNGEYSIVGNLLTVKITTTSEDASPGSFDANYWFYPDNPYQYFVVAEYSLLEPYEPSDLSYVDTRVLGGGVLPEKEAGAIVTQDEVAWYWDIGDWDGHVVPGMNTIIVEIPWYLEEEDTEIQTKVSGSKMAYGTYPTIRKWGPHPIITDFSVTETTITISINEVPGSSHLIQNYVYYKKLSEGYDKNLDEWTGPFSITNEEVTLSELESGTTYLIRLTTKASIDGNNLVDYDTLDAFEIKTLSVRES